MKSDVDPLSQRSDVWGVITSPYFCALLVIVATSAVVLLLAGILIEVSGWGQIYLRSGSRIAGLWALSFYVAWWMIYLTTSRPGEGTDPGDGRNRWDSHRDESSIVTVRSLLELRTARGTEIGDGEALREKARVTINTAGIVAGFTLILLSLNVELMIGGSELSAYRRPIAMAVISSQVIAVVLFVIAVDSFTATMNELSVGDDSERFSFNRYFYKKGVSNYYRGVIVLLFSVFLIAYMVAPELAVLGVVVFGILGYDYWFGYTRIE